MKGLEPSTFCMAGGAWVRGLTTPKTARLSQIAPLCDAHARRSDSFALRSIRRGLGTGT